MPKIPQFESNQKLNGKPISYLQQNTDKNHFGFANAKSLNQFAGGLNSLSNSIDTVYKKSEDAKIFEAYNSLNNWADEKLYNSAGGFFNKIGKDAVTQYSMLNEDLNDYIQNLTDDMNLSDEGENIFKDIIAKKREKILNDINQYTAKQTDVWANDAANESLNQSILNVVKSRNDENDIQKSIITSLGILEWFKFNNNLDEEKFGNLKKDTLSKIHCSVLDAYKLEGNLKAKEYFEKYKNQINENLHDKYSNQIKDMEFLYNVNDFSEKIIRNFDNYNLALSEIRKIENPELAEYVNSKVKSHFNQIDKEKELEKRKTIEDFYNNFNQDVNTNKNLSYADIPNSLSENIKLSLMNFVNNNGNPSNDSDIFYQLFSIMSESPKRFLEMDLNEKRGYLSKDIFSLFEMKQKSLNNSFSSTQLKDENMLINKALSDVKINDLISQNYKNIKNKVREYESRLGHNINDKDLKKVISDFGLSESYIDKYKKTEDSLNKRMEMIVDIFNDFEFYKTDGSKLSFDDKKKIVSLRVKNYKNK